VSGEVLVFSDAAREGVGAKAGLADSAKVGAGGTAL